MNFPSPPTIPQVPLDHQLNVPNYLLTRSFQKNLTKESVRHITYPRPVSTQITAGDHLFECYVSGYSTPVITIGFSICPIFCTPQPIVTFCNNPFTGERHIIVIWNRIPNILPETVENDIRNLGRIRPYDTDYFIFALEEFIINSYRTITPQQNTRPLSPSTYSTSPLEN